MYFKVLKSCYIPKRENLISKDICVQKKKAEDSLIVQIKHCKTIISKLWLSLALFFLRFLWLAGTPQKRPSLRALWKRNVLY